MLDIISTHDKSTFIFVSSEYWGIVVSIKQVVTIRVKFFVLFPFCFLQITVLVLVLILVRFINSNDSINIIIMNVKVYLTQTYIKIICIDLYIFLSTALEFILMFYRFYQSRYMQSTVDLILTSQVFHELLPHYIIFNIIR